MKRIIKRAKLLWSFIKIWDQAREIEKDLQNSEQMLYDAKFASQLRNWSEEKDLAFKTGYWEGIQWCLKRVKG